MKYFLLGAFSAAFFLFGIAMLYRYAGSVRLPATAPSTSTSTSTSTTDTALLLADIALARLGLLFKFDTMPLH